MNINISRDWIYYECFDKRTDGECVCLPHTFKVTDSSYININQYQKDSIYIKIIAYDKSFEGKRIFLRIDGAAHRSEVYINNNYVNSHSCGYTSYRTEITEELIKGDNEIAIRVDSRERKDIPPFGGTVDYLAYSGLYRDVVLEVENQSYISDVFVHTKGKTLTAETTVSNSSEECILKYELKDKDEIKELKGSTNTWECDVELWDLENPKLYELVVTLIKHDKVMDKKSVRFGFRDAVFKKDGFYLNGEKIKLRGLNRHQSYPYVGYAMPKSGQIFDADFLKNELKLNCVRTSHYPQSKHFIERCDEVGLLVFTELPGWQHIGDEKWQEQSLENVKDMVLQYRNHPSIILWGVRINESRDLDEFYEKTNEVARKLDHTRQTGGVRCYEKSHLLEDVYTYNDFVHDGVNGGVKSRKKVVGRDDVPYMVTEYNGHMFPTKPFDSEEHLLEHALRHARVLNDIAADDDIAGGFGWCMSDYQTHIDFGADDTMCYHGVSDMFRNLKPAAYVYKSQCDDEYVLDVMPSMNLGENPASILGKVYAFTNVDYLDLYINDEYINRFYPDIKNYGALLHPPIEIDDIIGDKLRDENYSDGVKKCIKELLLKYSKNGMNKLNLGDKLKALKLMMIHGLKPSDFTRLYETYIGNWGGKKSVFTFKGYVKGEEVVSAVKGGYEEKHLEMKSSNNSLIDGDTYDVALIRFKMLNQNDQIMRYYQEPLLMRTEGPIEIIGSDIISLKGGMGGTYIKTIGRKGKAKLYIKAYGLAEKEMEFEVE